MTTKLDHSTENVGFPIGCISVTQANEIVLGGGGGTGRSGVRNKLAVYSIDTGSNRLKRTHELELSSEEDAPTCLAASPKGKGIVSSINQSDADIKRGANKNCRAFTVAKKAISAGKAASTICSTSDYDYQKTIAFDPAGKLVASGSTDGTLAVLQYPSLHPAFPFVDAASEINDVCFSTNGKWLAASTNAELRIIASKTGSLVQTIDNPHTASGQPAVFRFARFGSAVGKVRIRSASPAVRLKDVLYTVLNTKSRKQAYIAMWNTTSWTRIATRVVGNSAITTFAISSDGSLLAFATASLQIAICDARSLRVLTRIQNAHAFAITALAFDNHGKYLVSGSADETCHVFVIPSKWPTVLETVSVAVHDNIQSIIMVFVLLLAIALSFYVRF